MPNRTRSIYIDNVEIDRLPNISPLITRLIVSNSELTLDHDDIQDNYTLETLSVSNCNLTNLTGIEKFKNVDYLLLDSNPITSLEPLRRNNCKEISLIGNTVEDKSPLDSCRRLIARHYVFLRD